MLKYFRNKHKSFLFLVVIFILGFIFGVYDVKNEGPVFYVSPNLKFIKNTGFTFLENAIQSNSDDIQTIYIDVKYKKWRKLVNQRNSVYNYNNIFQENSFVWNDTIEKVEIPAKLNYENKTYKIKIKLLGLNTDHYADPKKWSFRVSLKGDKTLHGQKKFNLLVPRSRYFINDFIGQQFLKELNLIPLRVCPVKLILNGEDLGLYYKEEFYDKRLIEFNNYRESPIVRLYNFDLDVSNSTLLKYNDLISKFQIKLHLFKEKKYSILDIFDLEKLADRIALSILFGDNHSLVSFNQRFYLNPFTAKLEPLGREFHFSKYNDLSNVYDKISLIKSSDSTLYKYLFNNNHFIEKLNKSILRVSSKEFLDKFEKKYSTDILKLKNNLHTEFLFFDSPLILLKNNAAILRINKTLLPSNKVKLNRDKLNDILEFAQISNDTIKINKTFSLSKKIFIPSGYMVVVAPGVNILFKDNGQILSESPFLAIGNINDSIYFRANNNFNLNKGILFRNVKDISKFKYVKFQNLNNYSDEFITVPGSITFYESNVNFSNTTFNTNYGGDDLLNIVRSKFSISNSKFLNSKADALDSDFSEGNILNTIFKNSGNDAIDVSGTSLALSNITIIDTQDKAISAGENSTINGNNIIINNASLALTSKDLSKLILNEVQIDNCDVVFTVFQKKPEYGPAYLNCKNVNYTNFKKDHMVQFNNSLMVNSQSIVPTFLDVESKLYGIEYGKSSK
jgi:hypothetical protein